MSHVAMHSTLAAAAALTLGLLSSSDASAVMVSRYDYQTGAAMCQPTLPAHGASLRAQPLTGITNTGAATIFVTCTYPGDDSPGGRGATRLVANVANYGASPVVTVVCTLVNGRLSGNDLVATYTARGANVGIGRASFLSWIPSQIEGAPPTITRPAIMCSLPSGAAVQFISTTYNEEIGA